MALIPYESLSYTTKLEYDEIVKRMQSIMEPKKSIRIIKGNSKMDYEGKFQENTFEIKRIVTFTNVFSPVIYGTTKKENDGTKIDIKLKLRAVVIVVMFVWLGVVGYVFFSSLVNFFIHDVSSKNLSTSLLVLAVGYIVMVGSFKSESTKDKNKLKELLEAEIDR